MELVRAALLLGTLLLTGGCSSLHPFDPDAESQKLLRRDAEWADVAAAGRDVDRIVSYWSDDAIVIPQGQPIAEGKAAIRDFVVASLRIPGFRIHWVSDKVTFSADGKLAYMHGRNTMTMRDANGSLVSIPGRGITIWRLEPDGQWRCVVDIWNDPPQPEVRK
jgi:ketosteroid isomerase-like protein